MLAESSLGTEFVSQYLLGEQHHVTPAPRNLMLTSASA